jgi:hypothetical protein
MPGNSVATYKRRKNRMTCAVWNAFTIMHARHGCSVPRFCASLEAQEAGWQETGRKSVLLCVKWTRAVTLKMNRAKQRLK